MNILMNILLATLAGSLIGLVLIRKEDTFGYFRKWLDEETQGDAKKRTDIEHDIERTLPNFHNWLKQQKEYKKRSRKKYFFYYLVALTLMGFIYIMQISL